MAKVFKVSIRFFFYYTFFVHHLCRQLIIGYFKNELFNIYIRNIKEFKDISFQKNNIFISS
jgi:hypothetical protein